MSSSTFQLSNRRRLHRGDHLQVRRPLGYSHHGIYISEERVIQFGGGLEGKRDASIEAVSLAEFERDGEAQIVVHDGRSALVGMWLPKADPPERIVERAEWLLENHPPRGRYNLIGNNCEHAANFCVAEYTESLQVRRFLLGKACAETLVMMCTASVAGTSRSLPRRWILTATLAGALLTISYHLHIRQFWREVGARWRAHDRAGRKSG